jgi:hypothetical protein
MHTHGNLFLDLILSQQLSRKKCCTTQHYTLHRYLHKLYLGSAGMQSLTKRWPSNVIVNNEMSFVPSSSFVLCGFGVYFWRCMQCMQSFLWLKREKRWSMKFSESRLSHFFIILCRINPKSTSIEESNSIVATQLTYYYYFWQQSKCSNHEQTIPTLSTWCKFAPGRFVAKSHFSTWCKFAPGRIILVPTVCVGVTVNGKSHKISHKILYLKIRPLRLFNIRP